jgi:TetR/AcrR family transcriptional regulator, regulator of autoinduction and epiphytic fitness
MTDLSLGVLTMALRSGLVDRLLELGGFMLRSQLSRLLQPGGGWLDLMQRARQTLKTP